MNPRKLSSTAGTWSARLVPLLMAAGGAFFFSQIASLARWVLAPCVGALVVYAALNAWRLKTVAVSRCDLVISHFGRTVTVPAIQVSEITGGRGRTPITLYFYEPIEFGDSIEFMPPEHDFALVWPPEPHPLVNELRQLCGLPALPDVGHE
jgi:hypothetical protein